MTTKVGKIFEKFSRKIVLGHKILLKNDARATFFQTIFIFSQLVLSNIRLRRGISTKPENVIHRGASMSDKKMENF